MSDLRERVKALRDDVKDRSRIRSWGKAGQEACMWVVEKLDAILAAPEPAREEPAVDMVERVARIFCEGDNPCEKCLEKARRILALAEPSEATKEIGKLQNKNSDLAFELSKMTRERDEVLDANTKMQNEREPSGLRAALEEIAKQRLPWEGNYEEGDIDAGYEECVKRARAAIAGKETHDE